MKYELKVYEKNNQWEWEVEALGGTTSIVAKGSNLDEGSAYTQSYNVISTITNNRLTTKNNRRSSKRKPYVIIGTALLLSGIIRGIGVAIGFDMVILWESVIGLIMIGSGKV